MDREILFGIGAFLGIFGPLFGWCGYIAHKANKTERTDVIGMLESDRVFYVHEENDRVAQEQVEQGQC